MLNFLRNLCVLTVLLACAPGVQAETVRVYTNASFAPLVIEGGGGLYADVVAYLNAQALPGLHFELERLPRKRLQLLLERNELDGIVIGLAPNWVDDSKREKYLWTEAFNLDEFVLVSLARAPFKPEPGARLGVTLGYVYPVIDAWIAQQKLTRNDAPTEAKNLEKLMAGRVGAVIVARSVLHYYQKTHKDSPPVQIDALPGPRAERRVLAPKPLRAVFEQVAPLVHKLAEDPAWQRQVKVRYE